MGVKTAHRHVLSKGIHLLVDRLTPSHRVLTFFADDGRLFFVIPMGPKTCIGTTDTPVDRPDVKVTPDDRRFVLDNINKRLRLPRPLTEGDVIAERCGVRPLVVDAAGDGARDWVQLSRKHAIEIDAEKRHISIFGGKLTDCLNVGEEICAEAQRLGVALPFAGRAWYGEPHPAVREEFFHQARLMDLDGMTSPQSSEPLSTRLWRRYGAEALGMLEAIRRRSAHGRGDHRDERVPALRDRSRRRGARWWSSSTTSCGGGPRSPLVVRREDIRRAAGLREACRILFGDEADARRAEYFGEARAPVSAP